MSSNEKTKIIDGDGNTIEVDMFNYLVDKNMFLSSGEIKIKDSKKMNIFLLKFILMRKIEKL